MNQESSLLSLLKQEIASYYTALKEDASAVLTSLKTIKTEEKTTADKNSEIDKEPSLLEFLPYITFDPKYGIFTNKNTMGFILRVSHFAGIDERAKNSLRSLIASDLPAGCHVQVINYASPRIGNILDYWNNAGNSKKICKKITEKRLEFFKRGSWQSILGNRQNLLVRDYELYFCFSLPKALTESGKEENLLKLKALQEKFIGGFKSIESAAHILSDKELASFMKEILLPSLDMYKQQTINKKDAVTDYFTSNSNIGMLHDRMKFDDFHYLTFEVTDFPEIWDLENSINYIGQFDPPSSITCPFYISYGFTLKSREDSEHMANKHRMIKTQQTSSRLPMFFPRMIDEINDWRYACERINHGERLGKAVMYVVLLAKDTDIANIAITATMDHFARLKFKLEQVKYDTLNSFLTTLPFGIAENWQILEQLKITSTLLSGAAMNLMPAFADLQSYASPLMLFVARRGQIFFFDNFKSADHINGNFNMVIVGNSGRGKSVWMQEYTSNILRHNGQVIIIDDGRSFQNTCGLFDGDFVDFGAGEFCINPFSLYREQAGFEDNKEYKEFFVEPLIELIVSILCIIINIDKNKKDDDKIGKYKAVLGNAVEAVLQKSGCNGGFTAIREELLHNPDIKTTQTEEICLDIAYILSSYSNNGRYSKYFNGESTLNICNDFTVFELSDLQHNEILQNSVLMTVVFLVYAKMQSRERRTALMIDEFWRLGVHPALKEPIEGFARRGRKYNLSLILASQCMSDFSNHNSPAGAAALAQADWRIMLSSDGKDEQMLKDELQMSPAEIALVSGLAGLKGAYSEFMIRHKSGNWQIGRLLLDPFSAKLYSTKAEDVAAIKKMRAEGITVEEAIERLL